MPVRVELQRAYRRLIAGLAFWQLVHALGLVAMGLLLLPGLNPGLPIADRARYLGEHAWSWRLGWLPWQLSAASDAWVALALWSWTRMLGDEARSARRWAAFGVVCLVVAIVPEQYAEARLVGDFVVKTAPERWGQQLGLYMWLTGTWANTGYTLMTACWLLAVHAAQRGTTAAMPRSAWSRAGELSVLIAFALASVANHRTWRWRESIEDVRAFALSTVLNGYAFPALAVLGVAIAMWVGSVQLQAMSGRVPDPKRFTAVWPIAGARFGRLIAHVAGAPGMRDLVRALQSRLPFPDLRSDVQDVLYLNWLVDADSLDAELPAGVRVQRYDRVALLGVLIFRHSHFGPALLGPLRRLFPSPIQCNVRAYLDSPPMHVAFLSNAIDSPAYFVGSRLLSDGLPAHLPAAARLTRTNERLTAAIDPGAGSALALHAEVAESAERSLPAAFERCFPDWSAAVAAIVPQLAAVRDLPATGQRCVSRIVVDAPLEHVRPARVLGAIELGPPLGELVAGAPLFAFVVPAVRFSVFGESWSPSPLVAPPAGVRAE